MCGSSHGGAAFSFLADDSSGSSCSSMASEMLPRTSIGPISRHADVLVVVQLVRLGAVIVAGADSVDDVVVTGGGGGSEVKSLSAFLISIRIISSSGSGIIMVRSSLVSDDVSVYAMP